MSDRRAFSRAVANLSTFVEQLLALSNEDCQTANAPRRYAPEWQDRAAGLAAELDKHIAGVRRSGHELGVAAEVVPRAEAIRLACAELIRWQPKCAPQVQADEENAEGVGAIQTKLHEALTPLLRLAQDFAEAGSDANAPSAVANGPTPPNTPDDRDARRAEMRFPRRRLLRWALADSRQWYSQLNQLAEAVAQAPGRARGPATKDPPLAELDRNPERLAAVPPQCQPTQTPAADSEQARLQAWDRLDLAIKVCLGLSTARAPAFVQILPAPELVVTSDRLDEGARVRLGVRRLLAAVRDAQSAAPLLVAVTRFLIDRCESRQEPVFLQSLLQRADLTAEQRAAAQTGLAHLAAYPKIQHHLTRACALLPAVQLGPLTEQTAAAAVRRLAVLIEEQLPAHFGLGQFLGTAGDIAERWGLGLDHAGLGSLVQVYLLPEGPWNAGIDAELKAAVRASAADVHLDALTEWLRGVFQDWNGEWLYNRLQAETQLALERSRERSRMRADARRKQSTPRASDLPAQPAPPSCRPVEAAAPPTGRPAQPTATYCLLPPRTIRWDGEKQVAPRLWRLLECVLTSERQTIRLDRAKAQVWAAKSVADKTVDNTLSALNKELLDLNFPGLVGRSGMYLVYPKPA